MDTTPILALALLLNLMLTLCLNRSLQAGGTITIEDFYYVYLCKVRDTTSVFNVFNGCKQKSGDPSTERLILLVLHSYLENTICVEFVEFL